MINSITYSNGLRLVHQEINAFRSVAMGIFVGTGSVHETPRNNGISHFIEHVNFKGTTTRSAFDIADEIEGLGAQINAYTSKSMTVYYTVSMDNHVSKCADVLSDILFNSVYDETELEKEKGVVLEEISMCEDTPDDACLELLQTAFYGDHPLGRPILGTPEIVKSFTPDMIREYLSRRYAPNNTVVSIVGNITLEDADKIVHEYFEKKFPSAHAEKVVFESTCPDFTVLTKTKPIEQANVAIAFPSIRFDSPEEQALMLMNNALGGGMSSRLFQRIREELGLVYSVYSYPSAYDADGMLTVYFATNPESVESALAMLKEEIDKYVTDGITDKELIRGKEQMKSSYVLSQENTRSLMNLYGKYMVLTGKVVDFNSRISRVDAVKKDDVNALIRRIFDFDKACVSYVGKDIGDVAQFVRNWQK